MTFVKHLHLSLFLLCSYIILQATYSLMAHTQYQQSLQLAASNIETRIALDMPRIDLGNPRFFTVANPYSVQAYLDTINSALEQQQSSLRVNGIQQTRTESLYKGKVIERQLQLHDQLIPLSLVDTRAHAFWYLNIKPLLAALLLTFLYGSRRQQMRQPALTVADDDNKEDVIGLSIDLQTKTLNSPYAEGPVSLPNKPLCFYTALLDYCQNQPHPHLHHNKDLPEELLNLANKYFYRLLELGHTKRKRPDFNANLDKTLSEIRAALDELFANNPDIKHQYYPPKAQGEGSRSKVHNYALEDITETHFEILGK